VHYLAKVELFRGWFLTWLFLHLGATPVDRSQPKNHGAMTAAATRLAREQLVGIFPEGTTSHNGELLPFKFGAVAVAQKTGAPIVPFSITGRYIPFARSLKITFGKPLFIDGDLKTANQKLRRAIQKLIRENQ
jgi:1-acyl-sn-glycerol-3-phosphate acyltransferase